MNFLYINEVLRIIREVEQKEHAHMEACVQVITNAILKNHSIFTFGASHAGILSEELFYRAGGLIVINPIFAKELMLDASPITHTSRMERLVGYGTLLAAKTPFKKGDVLITHSVSGRNPVTIEIAMEAHKRGVTIISITNLNTSMNVSSRHPSGKKLYEVSDIVIDNHGEKGDACLQIHGVKQKVAPTSTVISATIMNAIIGATTQELVHQGVHNPPIFYSANLDNTEELNNDMFKAYKDVIHYKYE